jgi:pyrroline-5-carboxylate reductase
MDCTLGFIGGGRITEIFLQAWDAADLHPDSILVSDADPTVLEGLRARHPRIVTVSENALPLAQDLVFLALHPPVMKQALAALPAPPGRETTIVSLAPVLDFQALSAALGGHERLVRMIPNAPSRLGKGYNPVAYAPGSPPQDRVRLAPLWAALGQAPEVHESQIEAFAILAAMGPTYFWPQWQVLRELGTQFGLPAEAADDALKSMLHGAVDLLFTSGLSYEAVMDSVPGKPLAEVQEQFLAPYREKLPALHARLSSTTP